MHQIADRWTLDACTEVIASRLEATGQLYISGAVRIADDMHARNQAARDLDSRLRSASGALRASVAPGSPLAQFMIQTTRMWREDERSQKTRLDSRHRDLLTSVGEAVAACQSVSARSQAAWSWGARAQQAVEDSLLFEEGLSQTTADCRRLLSDMQAMHALLASISQEVLQ